MAEIDKRRPRTGKAQRDPHEVHGRGSFPLAAAAHLHYGIEGNATRLPDTYGFTCNPGHLVNPDFDRGATVWTIRQAPVVRIFMV